MSLGKRKIGFLGGSFDPVHIGHLVMAETAYHAYDLEKVLFIPAYHPPHKLNKECSADSRVKMLEIALDDNKHFNLDLREINARTINYTSDTVRTLKKDYPDCELFCIVGEDSFLQIETWHLWEDLLSMVTLVAVRRPDILHIDTDGNNIYKKAEKLIKNGYKIEILEEFPIEISSSKVRDYCKKGKAVRYLIPDGVVEYIENEGLYVRD